LPAVLQSCPLQLLARGGGIALNCRMRLLLIDGHYYVYRSFFAIRSLSNSRGEPTNAIYGFIKCVRKMIKDLQPDLCAVLWDEGMPKRRTELQPDYKGTRAEMPDEMRGQLDFIQKAMGPLGLASIKVDDTEADDLMATYTCEARRKGHEVVLATNDKDLFQLVDEACWVYTTNKTDLAAPCDGFALLTAAKVQEKWGVPPEQIGEVLALIGDSVDNIPGIEGIGPKTAVTLIKTHGTLEALLSNLDAVKNEKLREKLRNGIGQIRQNQEMVRLDLDLPMPVALEDLRISPNYAELVPMLESCEFKGLTAEVRAEAAAAGASAPEPARATTKLGQGELF
jgi:DNA polymerase-1